MRKHLLLLTLAFSATTYAQVGITDSSSSTEFDDTPVSDNAVLELRSDSKGLLLPRLSSDAITTLESTAEAGLLVYDKDGKCFKAWDGDTWQVLGTACQTTTTNTAPTATNVAIAGTPTVGESLTGSYTYADTDGDAEDSTVLEWKLALDNTGDSAESISGASTDSYTIVDSDEGFYLQFCVTPADGTDFGDTVCSDWVGPVVATSGSFQNFDDKTDWSYTIDPATYNTNNDVWAIVTSLSSISMDDNFWGMRDLDNNNGGSSNTHTLTFSDVDISGKTGVVFSFDYKSLNMNATGDRYGYELFYDGTSQGEVEICNGCDSTQDSSVSINVPDTVDTFSVVIFGQFDGGSDVVGIDNIQLTY